MFGTASEKLATMYGPTRNLFLGPLSESAPAYLTGEFAGDYGFDVAGLASNPKRLERYRQAEIMNGRWAMLGVVGCVAPELLAKVSGVEYGDYGVWFKAGAQVFDPAGINYLGNPSLIHAQSVHGGPDRDPGVLGREDLVACSPGFCSFCACTWKGRWKTTIRRQWVRCCAIDLF